MIDTPRVAAARPEEVAHIADVIPLTPRPAAGDRRPIAFLPSDNAAYATAAHLADGRHFLEAL